MTAEVIVGVAQWLRLAKLVHQRVDVFDRHLNVLYTGGGDGDRTRLKDLQYGFELLHSVRHSGVKLRFVAVCAK